MPDLVGSIDAGTTSVRFIVFDSVATLIADHQLEFTQFFPHPGWQEQDAHEIVDKVNECIAKTIEKLEKGGKYTGKDIKVIGVTNQRETTVVWDKNSGKALTRAIAWPDSRTASTIRKLAKKSDKGVDAVKEQTGLPLCELFSIPLVEEILGVEYEGTRRWKKRSSSQISRNRPIDLLEMKIKLLKSFRTVFLISLLYETFF